MKNNKNFCEKCGTQNINNAKYCPKCGNILNNTHNESNKTKKTLLIALAIVIIGAIIILGNAYQTNQQNNEPILKNIKFGIGDFETLSFTADLNPKKDYDYLEIEIDYYDKDGNLMDNTPIAWNQNNIKSGQPIKINNPTVMSYYGKGIPVKAVVKLYDDVYGNEPLQTFEVNLTGGNNSTNNTTNATKTTDNLKKSDNLDNTKKADNTKTPEEIKKEEYAKLKEYNDAYHAGYDAGVADSEYYQYYPEPEAGGGSDTGDSGIMV